MDDNANVTSCGRVFHSWKAATGKVRSLTVVRRIFSDSEEVMPSGLVAIMAKGIAVAVATKILGVKVL